MGAFPCLQPKSQILWQPGPHNTLPFGRVRHNSRIESCLGCIQGALRVALRTKTLHFVWTISSVAYMFSSIKIDYSDYPKSLKSAE